LLIKWAEIYANTEVLSPIDRETWQLIAETSRIGQGSKVIELASGKGAFAIYLARRFWCNVDGYDINPEFTQYATNRAKELGLTTRTSFPQTDINRLEVKPDSYDLGACLGALYIFRDAGWKLLFRGVKPKGYMAVSDLVCKKVPAPQEVMDIFFEEASQPLTLEDARRWYTSRGVKILREVECSRKAWLEYYGLTKQMLNQVANKYSSDTDKQAELREAFREDELVKRFGEEYLNYVTFVMQKP